MYEAMKNLDNVFNRKQVWWGQSNLWSHPSIYSRKLSRILRYYSRMKPLDHPLLLIGSYLNSIFREMEFISDVRVKTEYRAQAEEFTRKVVRKNKLRDRRNAKHTETTYFDCITIVDNGSDDENMGPSNPVLSSVSAVGGTKRPFDVFEPTDSAPIDNRNLDEVSLRNLVHLDGTIRERKKYASNGLHVLQFWFEKRRTFHRYSRLPHEFKLLQYLLQQVSASFQ